MGMKKATKDRITAAYDKGFRDGLEHGYERAMVQSETAAKIHQQRDEFVKSLDAVNGE